MTEQRYIDETDVRAVVRLLGDVAVLPGDVQAKRRFVAEGLCKLLDAQVYIWVQSVQCQSDGRLAPLSFVDGGWPSPRSRDLVIQASVGDGPDPGMDQLMRLARGPRHVTLLRQEVIRDQELYGHEVFHRFLRPSGLDQAIYSIYPLGPAGLSSMITLFRELGQPPFGERERAIFHIVASEVSWLHREGTPSGSVAPASALSPRLREVLLFLLSGDSQKQIAYKLGLSAHTVHDHVKRLHRHFTVSSRGELLSLFLSGATSAASGRPAQSSTHPLPEGSRTPSW